MVACLPENAGSVDFMTRREYDSLKPNMSENTLEAGVFVPASGLTPVLELARLLGLWETDIEDAE